MACFSEACISQNKYDNTPNYNLNKPFVIKLPAELNEVSGIAYYAKDNCVFVESDNKGSIYKVSLAKKMDVRKWKFGHKDNYEDLVLLDSTFYVLNSNGDLYRVQFLGDSESVKKFDFPRKGNEFESIYYDGESGKLVLVCKDCKLDGHNSVSTYTFDLVKEEFEEGYVIDAKIMNEANGPESTRLKPSAATIHPITKELYLLSSVNKLLIIADRNGKIKKFYHLNPRIFNHPEGLTFTPAGDMFISNEAAGLVPPTILYFKYQKTK